MQPLGLAGPAAGPAGLGWAALLSRRGGRGGQKDRRLAAVARAAARAHRGQLRGATAGAASVLWGYGWKWNGTVGELVILKEFCLMGYGESFNS